MFLNFSLNFNGITKYIYVYDGKVIDKSNGDTSSDFYNKTILDLNIS